MKKEALLAICLALALAAYGCGGPGTVDIPQESGGAGQAGEALPTPPAAMPDAAAPGTGTAAGSDMFTGRDLETGYDESECVRIELNGDSAACSSGAVKIAGSAVTITDEGAYILAGTLDDGMLIIDAGDSDKLHLILDGVEIHSKTSAAIYILEADKVFITLAEGSANILSNGGAFTAIAENDIDAAVFSKQDLTFNGAGSLVVSCPAGHGIRGNDDLVFTGGAYALAAASHGLDANDSIRIANAAFAIESGKDGMHVENSDDAGRGFMYIANGTFDIAAGGDGLSAGAYMQIEGGSFEIVAGGGSANAAQQASDPWGSRFGQPAATPAAGDGSASAKGVKAEGSLAISGGTFLIDAADDAVHSNASIAVSGGTFAIASGDDAFHADETLAVAGGSISITESYEGFEALHIAISGGEIGLAARDDGINAAGGTDESGFGGPGGNDKFGGRGSSGGSIAISGGDILIHASGDGVDANGTLAISGGTITVSCPISGDTAVLDYDVSGTISGGTFIGTGASRMTQSFSESGQGVVTVSTGSRPEGTLIALADGEGNPLISHTPDQPFDVIILSSPALIKGETYTLSIGSASEECKAS